MKVRDVMSHKVITIRPSDPLALAEQMMVWSGIRHLPVVSEGNVVGVLTQRDVLNERAEFPVSGQFGRSVSEAMTSPASTTSPEMELSNAGQLMSDGKLGCLPVVQDDELVGILTTTDMLAAQHRQHITESPNNTLTAKDVMQGDPPSVTLDTPLMEATHKMAQTRTRTMPVLDSDGNVVGLLSERDLRLLICDPFTTMSNEMGALNERIVGDVMGVLPASVTQFAPLSQALFYLSDEWTDAVVVTDNEGGLVGLITYLDILEKLSTA